MNCFANGIVEYSTFKKKKKNCNKMLTERDGRTRLFILQI